MSKKLFGVIGRGLLGLLAVVVLALLGGVAVGYYSAHAGVEADQAILWVMVPVAVVMMIGSIWLGAAWMRSIDEAAQEAHKSSWYWGGSGGMAVGGVWLILASLPQSATWTVPTLDGRTDPVAYAATGAFAILLLMLVGYTVVWVWWWWKRR